jgi:2-C-methyl-D-erythritol 4-phosphate cytidylyltransferase
MNNDVAVIVLCGGRSTRFGENKLLVPLNGKPVFIRTLLAFSDYPIVLVVSENSREDFAEYLKEFNIKIHKIVFGGSTRQESVVNAVNVLDDFRYIAVHDGARPLISKNDIENVISDGKKYAAAVLGVPVKDTIKRLDGEKVTTLDRNELFSVQTPQVFQLNLYKKAILSAQKDYTDDCQLVENIGINPHITMGSYSNIKITTREDLTFAEILLK